MSGSYSMKSKVDFANFYVGSTTEKGELATFVWTEASTPVTPTDNDPAPAAAMSGLTVVTGALVASLCSIIF